MAKYENGSKRNVFKAITETVVQNFELPIRNFKLAELKPTGEVAFLHPARLVHTTPPGALVPAVDGSGCAWAACGSSSTREPARPRAQVPGGVTEAACRPEPAERDTRAAIAHARRAPAINAAQAGDRGQ